jgi:hypothetical protein
MITLTVAGYHLDEINSRSKFSLRMGRRGDDSKLEMPLSMSLVIGAIFNDARLGMGIPPSPRWSKDSMMLVGSHRRVLPPLHWLVMVYKVSLVVIEWGCLPSIAMIINAMEKLKGKGLGWLSSTTNQVFLVKLTGMTPFHQEHGVPV